MKAALSFVLFGLASVCFGQTVIEFNGIQEEPIFKLKEDSVQYSRIQSALNKSFVDSANRAKRDSLFQLMFTLTRPDKVVGFRRVYRANPDFFQFENLSDHTDFEQIQELSLSGKKIKKVPAEVFKCKNLEVLQLVNTSLSKINRKVNRLSALKMIIVYNNKTSKSLKLKKNINVETLVIRGDQPHYLPRSYKNFKALVKLDLSNNAITEFPNGANRNKKLKELILINNAITLKGNEIRPNLHLEKLDLIKNQISKVPSSIGNLPNLKTLKFNYNNITEIAPEISLLQNMESLSLYNNQLTTIPAGVYQLKSLKQIDLYYNQIDRFDERIIEWQNLEVLYLAYNKLFSLPDNLGKLKNLQELYPS